LITDGRIDTKYQYTDAGLRSLRDRCTAARTYCMFNNVHMAEDARRFARLIGASSP